jgi:hypothetical protein
MLAVCQNPAINFKIKLNCVRTGIFYPVLFPEKSDASSSFHSPRLLRFLWKEIILKTTFSENFYALPICQQAG